MKPVIAIVGRTNVGKSTLFNRLTRTKDALVANIAGLTRDRHYGEGRLGRYPFIVIDTGGFEPIDRVGIMAKMAEQTDQAIIESDIILFVVEAQGLNEHDREIAQYLRRLNRPIYLVINKCEGRAGEQLFEFNELGFKDIFAVSASHGQGVKQMVHDLLAPFYPKTDEAGEDDDEAYFANLKAKADKKQERLAKKANASNAAAQANSVHLAKSKKQILALPPHINDLKKNGSSFASTESKAHHASKKIKNLSDVDVGDLDDDTLQALDLIEPQKGQPEQLPERIKVAIVGRPNVGKSTYINGLLGEERLIAFDQAGTTRDSIYVDFEQQGDLYTLIDTAGIRKKGKVFEAVEKFSVIKTLQSISDSHVVILLLDASQDISDQDAHIARFILDSGRALVVAVNKWDALTDYERSQAKVKLETQFHFLNFAKFLYISAKKKQGIFQVVAAAKAAYLAAFASLSTPKLTRVLHKAIEQQAPRRDGIYRPKMRYAHQGGKNPPVIIIHGSRLEGIPEGYTRFLEKQFREAFDLLGTPLKIEYKNNKNPYTEKK
jgi:GTPase